MHSNLPQPAAGAIGKSGTKVHYTSRHFDDEKLEGQPKLPYTSCTSGVRVLTAAPGLDIVRLALVRQLACSLLTTSSRSIQDTTLQYPDAYCCLRRVRLW